MTEFAALGAGSLKELINMRTFTSQLLVVASFASALCLDGCAMPARSTAMAVSASPGLGITAQDGNYRRLAVTSVEGGRKTAALARSDIANDDLRPALERSLRAAGYLADDSTAASIDLSASIVRLDRPSFAFTTTVTSVLRYRTIARETGVTLLDTTVEAKGTARISDAFLATKRLLLADEASIRANIECFLKVLRTRAPTTEVGRESASGGAVRIEKCDG
jgi:hypothetical protein